ncbi:MAG: hypothetical protein MUE92_05570 [Chloroflexi bacterium]|nr:hypothetical protein [Chloroflexota bacterium]
MPELDPFDVRLTAAVRAFADRSETSVDATAMAERAIGRRRRPAGAFAWLTSPLPVPAGIVLLLGLLLAALLGATMIGGAWRDDRSSVIPPSTPSPSSTAVASPTAAPIAEINLAAIVAHSPPAAATCPPGSDPSAPGPTHVAWPALGTTSMAFDRQSGKIVALVVFPQDQVQTWTFDVCTNAWQRQGNGPDLGMPALVYDADSDRTVAFGRTGPLDHVSDRVTAWSYDLEADRWLEGTTSPALSAIRYAASGGSEPSKGFVATYHDPSGLVVVYDGTRGLAYDVEADGWSVVRWMEDWARPFGVAPVTLAYDPVRDRFVVNVQSAALADIYGDSGHRTISLDPATGKMDVSRPGLGFFCGWLSESCGTVYDAATGRTIWTDGGSHVESWDPGADTYGGWETLYYVTGEDAAAAPAWCTSGPPASGPPAADTLNGRVVCRGEAGSVAAFTPSTRHWQWLLAPQE